MSGGTGLLAVDIGNTSVHFAFRKGKGWGRPLRIRTSELRQKAAALLKKHAALLSRSEVILASVVPKATRELVSVFRRLGVRPCLAGKDCPVPIVNRYRNPRQVGVDRLLNALAAYRRVRGEAIVIDFGTAITFDLVSRKGEYLGGVIAPGIEISLEALFQKTALLPRIRLKPVSRVIGRDTEESIRIGCCIGIGGLCDRIVEKLKEKHLRHARVIATGGYASFMKRYCRTVQTVSPDLILDGLWLTHKSSRKI